MTSLSFCKAVFLICALMVFTACEKTPRITDTGASSQLKHLQAASLAISLYDEDAARCEMVSAETNSPSTSDAEELFFANYYNLHDVDAALVHGDRLLTMEHDSANLSQMQGASKQLQARKKSWFKKNAPPKTFTKEELQRAVRVALSTNIESVTEDPLAWNPEMQQWAHQLTLGATNEFHKAKLLFNGLSHRLDGSDLFTLTAQEAFQAWTNHSVALHCQEYAFLYVSLARSLGLNAYVTYVSETCFHEQTDHACASVFIDGEQLLVDPSYFWFGVPHEQFRVLNDKEAWALYLSRFTDSTRVHAATTLAPDLPSVQGALFCLLVDQNRWDEAKGLVTVMKLNSSPAKSVDGMEARIALHERRAADAVRLLHHLVEIDALNGAEQLVLAQAEYQTGHFSEARQALTNALSAPLAPDIKQSVRNQLATLSHADSSKR